MLTNKIRVIVDTNLWISSLIGRQLNSLRELLEMGSIGDCRIMTARQFEQEIWKMI